MLVRLIRQISRPILLRGSNSSKSWVEMTVASLVLPFLWMPSAKAQENAPNANRQVSSDKARYVVGFEHVHKGADGILEYRDDEIVFSESTAVETIRRDELVDAFSGTERAERGGTAGQVARFAVPYGGGAVLGAVSEKEVGLLTIDFSDPNGGLHSAVFVMEKSDAIRAARDLESAKDRKESPQFNKSCEVDAVVGAVQIAEIRAGPTVPLPAEYRAIMYEHLLSLSEVKTHTPRLIRLGDASGNCAPLSLSLQVTGLSKGNAAVRASSGPIGLFANVTSILVHVTVTERGGRIVLDSVEKGTRRGDKESLNAAVSVADKIGKDLRKAQKAFAGQ
jgi:hypothetical protein